MTILLLPQKKFFSMIASLSEIPLMDQRSFEWFAARLGIPTASNFEKIITPAGAPSGQAQSYLCRLLCERIFDRRFDDQVDTKWMRHGRECEDEAAREFEAVSNERVEPVGFVLSECGRYGCSPDRLIVGKNAALEIKCPSPWKHVEHMIYGPGKDYKPQVQGQMFVGGYKMIYFFSYFPGMPPVLLQTERDEGFIEKLRIALKVFCDHLDKKTKELMARQINYDVALATISMLMPEREDL
ncbi:MAG TPA: YqaJ viral recombinase family protein [Candidatus Acidoferrum sp.]